LLGILPKIEQQRQTTDRASFARLQVRAELQADCLAGIWAGKGFIVEASDVEAALRATAAAGDDMIRRKDAGQAVPDSFTHGNPEQRQRWFFAGYKGGTVAGCNTFKSTD
jgi:predicted metalloprotease